MRQCWPSASSSRSPSARRRAPAAPRSSRSRSSRWSTCSSAAWRDSSATSSARGSSSRCAIVQRLGAQRLAARARRRTERVDQPRAQAHAQQAVAGRGARAPPRAARAPRGRSTPASAWRPEWPSAASASASRSLAARACSAAAANVARADGVAGAQLGRAEREPRGERRRPRAGSARPPPRRPARRRLLGGGERVADGLRRPALVEVVGELGGVGVAAGLQRLADAAVQAHAAARALALVERLAHERVREGEAVELVGLADQAGRAWPPPAPR